MKKFLLILPFIAVVSCTYENQKVKLNFDLNNQSSTIGANKGIDVVVIDERTNKPLLGRKKYINAEIEITPDADLAVFLQQKILQNLTRRGFQNGRDKIIIVHIETLAYKVKSSFPIGTSNITASLKVVVQDNKSGTKFTKNYGTSWDSKHFLAPLESTDAETINSLIRDVVQEIVSDDSFLESLMK